MISSAREFGGKLLVADAGETQISIVDFTTGNKTALGRQGAGPGEYNSPVAIFRLRGDTVWVLDAQGQSGRIVSFVGTRSGTTFPVVLGFDLSDSSVVGAPMDTDLRGMLYATATPMRVAAARGTTQGSGQVNTQFADSATLIRTDPRVTNGPRTKLARLRYFLGKADMKQQIQGTNVKVSMEFPGIEPGDSWAVFPDGRIGIVRGETYTVEYITPDGKPGPRARIPYERARLTASDQKLEMDAARRLTEDQMVVARKMLPPGWTMQFEMTPPASWPSEYPAVAPFGVRAAPDGSLWVQRSVPERVGREQWDVIDAAGKLVARWQLPLRVNLIAIGDGAVYTTRRDEDDLRYVQRIVLPR
jgi:hypothetical protein